MTYGPLKYRSREIVDAILASVERQLIRSSEFGNPSLAYHGAEWEFTLDIRLSSRVDTAGRVQVTGRLPVVPLPGESQPPATLPTVATHSGAGRKGEPKPKAKPGEHVITRTDDPNAPDPGAAMAREQARVRESMTVEGTFAATDTSNFGG
jgi:hypothetical protein